MMNDRARLWSKRKSAPFADPRDEERALREMRKSIDHSFNFNIDFKGEQPYMITIGRRSASVQAAGRTQAHDAGRMCRSSRNGSPVFSFRGRGCIRGWRCW